MIYRTGILLDVKCTIKHETEKAFLIRTDEGKECWLPKSQCEDNGDGTLTMPEWLAVEKELI